MKFLCGLLLLVSTAKAQLITDSLLIEGHYRTFCYFKPAVGVRNSSLLFLMHGSGGEAGDVIRHSTALEAMAPKEQLLIVYPNGYQRFWNECRKYSNAVANKEDINEQAFFLAMIERMSNLYHINPKRVYAAGFSGGGHMAYKLGLTMPDKISGIAAVVANLPDSASCDCSYARKAMPVLIINGTADGVNPFEGGEMFVNNASFGVVLSAQNSFRYWASLAGYSGTPAVEQLPNVDTTDHQTIEAYHFRGKKKPPVTLLKVIGGKHEFPGDIDAFVYAWRFFNNRLK